jgi:hypothetical protein
MPAHLPRLSAILAMMTTLHALGPVPNAAGAEVSFAGKPAVRAESGGVRIDFALAAPGDVLNQRIVRVDLESAVEVQVPIE